MSMSVSSSSGRLLSSSLKRRAATGAGVRSSSDCLAVNAQKRALSGVASSSRSRQAVGTKCVAHAHARFSTSTVSRQAEQLSSQSQSSWASEKVAASLSTSPPISTAPSVNVNATNASAEWATSYLSTLFPSLPSPFPAPVAARMLTHMSYRAGALSSLSSSASNGHNARLAFLGRRVLKAYYLMHLHASVPESVLLGPGAGQTSAALGAPRSTGEEDVVDGFMDFEAVLEQALDTRVVGEGVAAAWGLERGVRWTSAIPPQAQFSTKYEEHSYRKGRDKVFGTTVEAVIGGVFHQFGGAEAYTLFHSHVLPHLYVPASLRQGATTESTQAFRLDNAAADETVIPPAAQQQTQRRAFA